MGNEPVTLKPATVAIAEAYLRLDERDETALWLERATERYPDVEEIKEWAKSLADALKRRQTPKW